MRKILCLTTINNTVALKDAVDKIWEEFGKIVMIKKIYFDDYEDPDVSLKPIEDEINSSEIILVDIRGDVRIARELPKMLDGKNKTIIVLVAGGQHIFALTKMGKFRGEMIFKPGKEKEFDVNSYIKAKKFSELTKKLGRILPFGRLKDMRKWVLAQEYYTEGDAENLKNLILFLLKSYAGFEKIKKVPPPKPQPSFGLYVPNNGFYDNFEDFKRKIRYKEKKPTIGLLLYGGMHFSDTKPIADALYDHLKNDVNVIPIFSKVEYNIEAINKYLKNIDLLLNLQYFRIHGGPYGGAPEPTYEFLKDVDAPVIIGLRSYDTEIENWSKSKQGINPLEVVLGVTLPELDGSIEPIFVAGLESVKDPKLGTVKQIRVLEDRIEKLSERIKKWLVLRSKPNNKKRLAIITYNYPPGEGNLANAGYLDVFKSLGIFLKNLKKCRYAVDIPGNIKDLFLKNGLVNSPEYLQKSGMKVHVNEYLSWFKSLPKTVQEVVIKHWGKPPGNIMVDRDHILIPGIILGNIFLGIQPARGVHEDPDKAYHDKDFHRQ